MEDYVQTHFPQKLTHINSTYSLQSTEYKFQKFLYKYYLIKIIRKK